MKSERLSFAKRALLTRSAEALFTAYEMLEEYDEESIREFLEGDVMVITKRNKSESTVHVRPLNGSIIIDEDDCEFLGDKEAFGFNKYQ